jgi:predicted anti-sigma-YlaC factor YlaD
MNNQDDKAGLDALDRRGQNECARFRESISASLDAEDTDIRDAAIDDHLNQCVGCRNFFEFSASLKRAGIRRAPSMTDLAPSIVKRFNVGQPRSVWSIARGVLAICAVEVIVFSLFDLVGGTHESRHLGSFSIAFGVVLLSVVVRPVRARLMFPVTGVLALSLMITAIVDMINGSIPLVTEARHVPEIISVAMMWLLAKPQRTRFSRTSRGVSWIPSISERNRESA